MESLPKSFLWEKINAPEEAHFYDDHPGYGAIMPFGSPALTYGELEFILAWIIAGAPEMGEVVDPKLLEKTDRYEPELFEPLLQPANGIQLHIEPFNVNPNYEREFFRYKLLNNPEPVYVNRIEVLIRPGSHHFLLYWYGPETPTLAIPQPEIDRDLRDDNGEYIIETFLSMRYQLFLTGTQWPRMDYEFPAGVALELPPNFGLDLNSHYVNRSDSAFTGEVYVNLHVTEAQEVEHEAMMLVLGNNEFHLPAGQVTTVTDDFFSDERIHIFQLFSHAHELMTEFRAEIIGGQRDGELIYFTDDWEHPPILDYDPPLTVEPDEGIRLIVTYNNTRDRDVQFGFLSTDEMLFLFGFYYTDTDESEPTPWDVNSDGVVNILDLVTIAVNFGKRGTGIEGDVNRDGVVNVFDLALVGTHFGEGSVAVAPSFDSSRVQMTVSLEEHDAIRGTLSELEAMPEKSRGAEVAIELLRAWLANTAQVAAETKLLQNYPSPFNPETWIPYQLKASTKATIEIHALSGRLVRTFDLGLLPAGFYTTREKAAYWDGRNTSGERVASGVYFYTLQTADYTETRKMLIAK